mmetsp:Transcript_100136/g.192039  ORF Transcript_100136/g.192039 Transcript_100136/m.192039 type:complete len:381 (-) Transcript_100136:87-1229(-)
MALPAEMKAITTTVLSDGLTLELEQKDIPLPKLKTSTDILVRIEAAPVNPSDIGVMFGVANKSKAKQAGPGKLQMPIEPRLAPLMRTRVGEQMQCGNEACGVVVSAGSDPGAQRLIGKLVAILGGQMYAQYRRVAASSALELPDGTDPADGASCFVNPLTVLSMVGTMRHEGHSAIVHTAAASNLGQMLLKVCMADGIPLVNIVRSEEQANIMLAISPQALVVNSALPSYHEDMYLAIKKTKASLAFDATGGGHLASDILAAMERVHSEGAGYSTYGSLVHKQVYLYGGLDTGPTMLHRAYGMKWSIGGWLLNYYLSNHSSEFAEMRQRVVREISTTFKSSYARELTLTDLATVSSLQEYDRKQTGLKSLVRPQKNSAKL